MIMTASASAPSPAPMTSAHTRRHRRSSSGSTFSPFSPLPNIPRRARSVADGDSLSPPRVKKASFTLAGSSDDDDDDDCPLVREVNQRARMAKLTDEHFGDFSFDAEVHKAKTSKPAHGDDDTETETEADFPPTPVGDAAPTPKLTISTDVAPVPFPALSPSPVESAGPLPPLTIPDSRLATSPVVRSASSPLLSSPAAPKPEPKLTPASSVCSTSPYGSGASTPILLKNGRPLKPSLKSRVSLSMSTPDVSSMLAQAKSAPSTPRVHFPTRERLESVVLFDKRARPLEVASGDSPLASPRSGFFADMDTTPGLRIRNQSSFPFPNMSPRGSPLGSSVNLQGLPAAIMAKTKLKIAVSRSAPLQPVPRPGAHVHLAAVRLLGTRMSGSVLVKNVSFSKKVILRYTFDSWETTSEVAGMWSSPNALKDLPASASNAELKPFGSEETELDVARGILVPVADGWDRFVFNIKLDDVAPYLSKRSMFLAVKFEGAGVGEWWDNCGGLNYRFEFDHVPKAEPKTESPAPTIIGRPRSNTSPAPLNTDSTQTDLPSATLLSAKLSVVEKHAPRPNLKLQFPSDETVTPADMTSDLGAELVAPKLAPIEKKVPLTLTPPDSTASSPRETPAPLPVPAPAPVASLPSPAESPASRKQPSPLPSPSAIEAPAHNTTNVKDQSYADFIAKYCFAGGSASAPSARPASAGLGAPSTGPAPNAYSPPISGNSWGSPRPNFGWGASTNTPAQNSWGGVGFSYGRSGNSFSGGDL
ncbi:Protein phosphatase 1 regulatory subunit 3D [Ceratobasidium sp. 370]|nr:Protein phosphatase 1 regulatory subunit 3D [Ceratobasidium sp. 370]